MKTDNQAKNVKTQKKLKRPTPEASRTGVPMPSYESYHQVTMLIINRDIPEFEPGALAATLLLELEKGGHALPEATYMAVMRVAACLKKRHSDEVSSEIEAHKVIRKARAAQ